VSGSEAVLALLYQMATYAYQLFCLTRIFCGRTYRASPIPHPKTYLLDGLVGVGVKQAADVFRAQMVMPRCISRDGGATSNGRWTGRPRSRLPSRAVLRLRTAHRACTTSWAEHTHSLCTIKPLFSSLLLACKLLAAPGGGRKASFTTGVNGMRAA